MIVSNPKFIIIAALFVFCSVFGMLSHLYAQTARPAEADQVLSVTPGRIDFGVLDKSEVKFGFIDIENKGQEKIRWIIKRTEPWLSPSVYSGIAGDGVETVAVIADPTDLSPGLHETEIVITSSAGTRTVPVSITVLGDSDDAFSPKLEEIRLSDVTSIQVGRKMYLSAVGIYSDGSRKDITKEIQWVSRNEQIGYFADKGLLIGKKAGDAHVSARKDGVESPILLIHVDTALDGPVLKVSLPKSNLDHMEKGSVETIPLTIWNAGKGNLQWEVISMDPWLVVGNGTSLHGLKTDGISEEGIAGTGLFGEGKGKVTITVNTAELQNGRHEGSILIRSNGGSERITIPVKIRSLESISLTPVLIKTTVNHRTMFRAVGIWSDGSRTDLSKGSDGEWLLSDHSIGFFPRGGSVFMAKNTGSVAIRRVRGDVNSNVAFVDVGEDLSIPVLLVSPREVDLGTIGPGESARGLFSLKNVGSGDLTWMLCSMEDWTSSPDENLSGTAGLTTRRLGVSVESVADSETAIYGLSDIHMKIEAGHKSVSYRKILPPGTYKEELKLSFNGGERTLLLQFTVAENKGARSSMEVSPLGIGFGSVGADRKLMKRVELRNAGKNVLTWNAMLQGNRKTFRGMMLERGRYVSFANEAVSGKGSYGVPDRLKNELDVSGEWSEDDGYPYGNGEKGLLKYIFSGKGISLFIWKNVGGGNLDVFLDSRMIGQIDCASDREMRVEFPVAENLSEGEPHVLVLAAREGNVRIEGVRISVAELMKSRKNWIRIFPEKGITRNETDYINVMIDTTGLSPGLYSENILFYSKEGVEIVEVSLDVTSDRPSELIDIYRYTKGADSLLSPDEERGTLSLEGYKKRGPVFKLFHKGTPGTMEFFQWHNFSKSTHFYSYSRSGGNRSLKGYVFDGSIGNIATLKLPNTKDLYRWFNPETRAYFYTTDPKGEDCEKMGYKYDGVAGYVR